MNFGRRLSNLNIYKSILRYSKFWNKVQGFVLFIKQNLFLGSGCVDILHVRGVMSVSKSTEYKLVMAWCLSVCPTGWGATQGSQNSRDQLLFLLRRRFYREYKKKCTSNYRKDISQTSVVKIIPLKLWLLRESLWSRIESNVTAFIVFISIRGHIRFYLLSCLTSQVFTLFHSRFISIYCLEIPFYPSRVVKIVEQSFPLIQTYGQNSKFQI